jgi:formyl-CoA transferase/CoA:oxalate CoA-transferase
LVVAVGSERQWRRLCAALDVAGLADDPRFATNGDRVVHRDELRPLLAERLVARTRADWQVVLEAAEVPCGPILDVLEAFESPQAQALGMSATVTHPVLGELPQAGIPFTFERTPATIRTAPPLLGQHTDEILAVLGYETADVERFRSAGVV